MRKKKVLIVMPCDLPVPAVKGGAVATLIESLIAQNDCKNYLDLDIFTNACEASITAESRFRCTKFIHYKENVLLNIVDRILFKTKKILRKLSVIWQVKLLLKNTSYDFVVMQNSGYLLNVLSNEKIAVRYQNKIFYHLHNDVPDSAKTDFLRKCNFLIISDYLKKKLSDRCGVSIGKHCFLLKNCINVNRFSQELSQEEKNLLKQKFLLEGKRVLLFVGRIDPAKGISELLDAVELLENEFVLLVVGSTNFGGKESSPFEKMIKVKCEKLGRKVVFTGFIHNEEIWKFYKLADIAVFPSVWEEPAGLTMLEASVAGIPLVTTKSGGIPEYINNKSAVFLDKDCNLTENICSAVMSVCSNLEFWKKNAFENQCFYRDIYNESEYYRNFCSILESNCHD